MCAIEGNNFQSNEFVIIFFLLREITRCRRDESLKLGEIDIKFSTKLSRCVVCVNTTNFADAESVHTDQQMLQAFFNSFKKMLNCKIMRRKLSYSSTSQLSKWLSIDKEKVERSRRRERKLSIVVLPRRRTLNSSSSNFPPLASTVERVLDCADK